MTKWRWIPDIENAQQALHEGTDQCRGDPAILQHRFHAADRRRGRAAAVECARLNRQHPAHQHISE